MVWLPKMIDMAKTPDEIKEEIGEMVCPSPPGKYKGPRYPYGLALCLGKDELEKLDLDTDCEVGDTIHLFALAKVTSASQSELADGTTEYRIELQITHLGVEDENDENEEMDRGEGRAARRYGGKNEE
jgi:hypothetical protein